MQRARTDSSTLEREYRCVRVTTAQAAVSWQFTGTMSRTARAASALKVDNRYLGSFLAPTLWAESIRPVL